MRARPKPEDELNDDHRADVDETNENLERVKSGTTIHQCDRHNEDREERIEHTEPPLNATEPIIGLRIGLHERFVQPNGSRLSCGRLARRAHCCRTIVRSRQRTTFRFL